VHLTLLDGELAVERHPPDAPVPSPEGPLWSVTRTADELSVIRPGQGWRAFAVEGPLDHGLTGVLASIAAPLAAAGVPIFAVSTYDTDYVLVPAGRVEDAAVALRGAGHAVSAPR
jgi:uncharacterized protein